MWRSFSFQSEKTPHIRSLPDGVVHSIIWKTNLDVHGIKTQDNELPPVSGIETQDYFNPSHAKLFCTHTLCQGGGGGGVDTTSFYFLNPLS